VDQGADYLFCHNPSTNSWTRSGDKEQPGGMACLLSSGDDGRKWDGRLGKPNSVFHDITDILR